MKDQKFHIQWYMYRQKAACYEITLMVLRNCYVYYEITYDVQ